MSKKTKIAFIGAGSMGQCAHLKNYAALTEHCEIIALAELRENTGKAVAEHYGIPRVYQTAAELLANEKPDGLVASQPFNRHGIILDELLNADIPVFIEKPLAASIPVAEKILAKSAAGKSKIMVGYHKRSDPATIYVKKEIDRLRNSQEIGRMKYLRITMPVGDWIAGGFAGMIHKDDILPELANDPAPADMDENTFKEYIAFVNYYIHQVNLMRHLLGEDYRVTFADKGGILLVGESRSGISCCIEMNPYQTSIDWQESALICFEKGYIKLDLPAPLASNRPGQVEILRDLGGGAVPETIIPQLPWKHAMLQQAENFLKFSQGEIEAPCGPEEALLDLQLAKDYIDLLKKS